jgi:hypothetical protein
MSTKKGISHKDDSAIINALDKKVKTLKAKNRSAVIAHYLRNGLSGVVTEFKGPFKAVKPVAKKAAKKVTKKAVAKKATKKTVKSVA